MPQPTEFAVNTTQNETLVGLPVSIGMPVFNGASFIREALDSLLAQTFTNFELIIADNASTDDTSTICLEYANLDKRIRYVRHGNNRGALENFNFVLNEARGQYFMWAAADDYWSPDWLYELTIGMNDASYSCAIGCVKYIDNFGKPIFHDTSRGGFLTKFPILNNTGSPLYRVIKFFFNRNDMLVYGLLRTEAAKSIRLSEGEYIKLPHDQAYAFLYYILTFGGIYINKNCVIYKRVHSEQASRSGPMTLLEQYLVNKNHVSLTQLYMKNSSLSFVERCILTGFMYLYLNASLIKNRRNIGS